jgi:choline dehydrogenase
MGSGENAVTTPDLKVRGIDGLRVVDASVMPLVPSCNTNGPTIMVAEKASDVILGREPLSAVF